MPLLCHKSSIRVRQQNASLTLQSSHSLIFGEEHDVQSQQCSTSYDLKKPLPPSVDVFSHSDLTFIISVIVDGRRLTRESVKRSLVTLHLIQMLRDNSAILCINNVSDAFIDGTHGHVKVNITPQRSKPPENPSLQIALVSIHLTYHCKAAEDSINDTPNSLAACRDVELLNQAVDKLMTYQLAKRYPLIFGPWGEKLELEKPYFRSVARSLFAMVRRSPNDEFRIQVRRYLKILRKRLRQSQLESVGGLEECCGQLPDYNGLLCDDSRGPFSDEDFISEAMQRLFKLALRPSLIRCTPVAQDEIDLQDDDRGVDSLALHSVLDDGDYDSDATEGDDDLMCSSELEESPLSSGDANWTFLSRPPIRSEVLYGTQDPGSSLDADRVSALHRTIDYAKEPQVSFSKINNSGGSSQGPRSEQLTKSFSEFYDSDSGSDTLSIAALEENSSSTLYSEASLDDRDANTLNFCYSPETHVVLTAAVRMDQGGHNIAHIAPADRSCSQAFLRMSSSVLKPTFSYCSGATHESPYDDNAYQPADRSLLDNVILPAAPASPASPIDPALHTSSKNSSYSSLPSDSIPMTDFPAASISFADDMDMDNWSLDCSDEPGGEGGSACCSGESTFPTSHGSRIPGLITEDVTCTLSLEKAAESGDQVFFPEGLPINIGSEARELDGVFEFADQMDFDDGGLGLDSGSDYDGLNDLSSTECSSSGRLGLVEMETILDSGDEEDGECRWSSLV